MGRSEVSTSVVKWSEGLSNWVFAIIRGYVCVYVYVYIYIYIMWSVLLIWLFRLSHSLIFFWFHFFNHCIYSCMFCMHLFNFVNCVFLLYVYIFLLLCMFCSGCSVSLCCYVYCMCVNVYCTMATGFQPNCS